MATKVITTNNISITGGTQGQVLSKGTGTTTQWIDLVNIPINNITSEYTLTGNDNGKLIKITSSGATTITIPPNSAVTYPMGAQILINQYGTGQVTISSGVGVIINSANAHNKTSTRYSTATIIKVDTDTWLLQGDLSA